MDEKKVARSWFSKGQPCRTAACERHVSESRLWFEQSRPWCEPWFGREGAAGPGGRPVEADRANGGGHGCQARCTTQT
ncbi:hypothetical protein F511_30678 [Dorcoceras hygrometricum]|uniref:Uncharacterized protein n=1 Tax=Dorcoceras hygrometricum TaxID=472368 RepID=A0A2Z7B4F2_9LAMI|nr:hypothetical protein F511_30678 [Dorcoceras hygrometricum]